MPDRMPDIARTYLYIAAITVITLIIVGAGAIYALFLYQGRPAPSGIVLLIGLSLQQIAILLLGKNSINLGRNQEDIKTEINGKMDRIGEDIRRDVDTRLKGDHGTTGY